MSRSRRVRGDRGQAAGPEMMVVLVFAVAAWGLLAFVGRLNSTSQDISNTAQAAARAASLAPDPASGRTAANRAVSGSNLPNPCTATPTVAMSWSPGENGSWVGGTVTVRLRCTIANRERYAGAGRTVSADDTQVVDRYRDHQP